MRRRLTILAGRARQPGIGTIGVIGTITAVLLAVAVMAVPSTAKRADAEPVARSFLAPALRAPDPEPVPVPVRLTVTAPQVIRGSAGLAAVATPASEGRTIVFETRRGSAWVSIASAREDTAGRATARSTLRSYGAVEIRARVPGVTSSASVVVVNVRPGARVYTWREWIEKPGWSRADFVMEVGRILADSRGWGATGEVFFQHITSGTPRMWVKLATPRTTDRLCAPTRTHGIWNCRAASGVVVNSDRWFTGRSTWHGSLADYRGLIINHETGHVLGFGHRGCPGRGRAAPVMQQQGVNLEGCRPNAWPLASEIGRL